MNSIKISLFRIRLEEAIEEWISKNPEKIEAIVIDGVTKMNAMNVITEPEEFGVDLSDYVRHHITQEVLPLVNHPKYGEH